MTNKEMQDVKWCGKDISKEMYVHALELLFDDANNHLTIKTIREIIEQRMKKEK
jgi:hypothetical protein